VRSLLVALVVVLGPTTLGAASAGASFVYVGGSGSISQFRTDATGLLSPLAPAIATPPADPVALAAGPDGQHLYAALDDGSIAQYAIDAGGQLQPLSPPTVPGGGIEPFGIAASADGRHVYVTTYDGSQSVVAQFAVGADGTLAPLGTPSLPADEDWGIALDSASRHAYVVDAGTVGGIWQFAVGGDGSLAPLSPPHLVAGFKPSGIAVSPHGSNVYVVDGHQDLLQFSVGADGALTPLSPPTVATSGYPVSVAVSPDGRSVYAAQVDAVSQFDVQADGTLIPKSTPSLAAGSVPWALAIAPGGRSVYTTDIVSSGSSGVWQFGVGNGGLLAPLSPSAVDGVASPSAVAVAPSRSPTAMFSVAAAPPGAPTALDGSGSAAPAGSVARYDWDFGDGSTQLDGPAATSHVYANAGTYTATLTVTDSDGCSTAPVSSGQTAYCAGSAVPRATHAVIVAKPAIPPIANAVVTRGKRTRGGQTFRFDGGLSIDQDGRIVAYAWKLGGHAISRAKAFGRFFSDAHAVYRVTLTVTDDAGLTGSTSVRVSPRAAQLPPLRVTLPAGATYCIDCVQPSRRAAAVVRRLRRYARGARRVEISSYADATGTRAHNLALTRRRAQTIARLLLSGLSPRPQRVALHAFGETRPVATNATASGRARNRRSTILIVR
jgi:hypothetical protein